MACKICKQEVKQIFTTSVMNKHTVSYYQCVNCKFIQTEKPYWLDEAYNNAITSLDIGYVTRNIMYSQITASIIKQFFSRKASFIDYGGGYGMFVRMMRDIGFDYYRQDLYCENLFSKFLDVTDSENADIGKFELLTAFEVFEHLENPMMEIEKMFEFSDNILFSTELQPDLEFKSPEDWPYIIPEIGQHIALFSKKSLDEIARIFKCNVYSNNTSLHLITKKKFIINPVKYAHYKHKILDVFLGRNFSNSTSLIQHDFDRVMQRLKSKK